MTSGDDSDADDDFSDIYKAYTGPLGSKGPPVAQENSVTSKRSHSGSDEEEESHDPNAVPTDFTSREAKVWEAKSKATERNWKKRKEEEMRCKICGESGHFTQGCPSTLGANNKLQDFIERVPARELHVKALFSEEVVSKIELDIGCKIKIEEKFIIVSGKDRLILKKGVNAVRKIKEGENKDVHKTKEEGENKDVHYLPEVREHRGSSSSRVSRSRSPERRSPLTSRFGRSDMQKSIPSHPNHTAHVPDRYGRLEKVVEDHVCEDLQKMSESPQAYGSDGGRGRPSHSKSPGLPSYMSNSHNSYERHSQSRGNYVMDADRGVSDMHSLDRPCVPRTLDEIEFQYRRQAMELTRYRDKEEDEENYKHRETIREIGEKYMKKVGIVKATHDRMWEEFLQLEGQRRQHQQARGYISSSGNGGYKQASHTDFTTSSGADMPMDNRARYRNDVDSYPSSRPHDNYGEIQRQRRDEFGKPYNRF